MDFLMGCSFVVGVIGLLNIASIIFFTEKNIQLQQNKYSLENYELELTARNVCLELEIENQKEEIALLHEFKELPRQLGPKTNREG